MAIDLAKEVLGARVSGRAAIAQAAWQGFIPEEAGRGLSYSNAGSERLFPVEERTSRVRALMSQNDPQLTFSQSTLNTETQSTPQARLRKKRGRRSPSV